MSQTQSDDQLLATSLTQEGYKELKAELQELQEVKLPKVIDRVATAREHGDLSENAEYHSAKEEQELVETRIDEIETILAKAKVVKNTRSHTKIGMGSKITIQKKGHKQKQTITIVGEYEADPDEGKMSISSPLGKALKGKKVGDKVKVTVPAGDVEYEILKLT